MAHQLGCCPWIPQRHNVLLIGPKGTGKNSRACGLGKQACRQGLTARRYCPSSLLESSSSPSRTRTAPARG